MFCMAPVVTAWDRGYQRRATCVISKLISRQATADEPNYQHGTRRVAKASVNRYCRSDSASVAAATSQHEPILRNWNCAQRTVCYNVICAHASTKFSRWKKIAYKPQLRLAISVGSRIALCCSSVRSSVLPSVLCPSIRLFGLDLQLECRRYKETWNDLTIASLDIHHPET